MLELWAMCSTPSLPSLPDPLWPWVVALYRALSIGQIEQNCILMLNWIVWNRTYKGWYAIEMSWQDRYSLTRIYSIKHSMTKRFINWRMPAREVTAMTKCQEQISIVHSPPLFLSQFFIPLWLMNFLLGSSWYIRNSWHYMRGSNI